MTRRVGFYWWRGRVLTLLVREDGSYAVRGVPPWMRDMWRRDVVSGRAKLLNP